MPTRSRTPGVWEAGVATLKVGVPAGVEQFAVCAQGNPQRIIAVTGAVGAPDEAESIANAVLLAAAPELLERASSLVNAISDDPDDYADMEMYVSITNRASMLRKAISKAKGE